MRYVYNKGVEKRRRLKLPVFLALVMLVGGGYLLINTVSPVLPLDSSNSQATVNKLTSTKPTVGENRLYIPQINVDVAIVPINGNEQVALEKGAINRSPSSGNPQTGGNFVLAAHRFSLGLTPSQTRAKSPFYHMDKLRSGDQFFIDYGGTRYVYEVFDKQRVDENDTSIESRTDSARVTLYTCELTGPKDGREVVYAKPVGRVAWQGGRSGIESN